MFTCCRVSCIEGCRRECSRRVRATEHACNVDEDDDWDGENPRQWHEDLLCVEAAVMGLWWIGREWCFGVREHNGRARCDACVAAGMVRLLFIRHHVEGIYSQSSILYRRVQTRMLKTGESYCACMQCGWGRGRGWSASASSA